MSAGQQIAKYISLICLPIIAVIKISSCQDEREREKAKAAENASRVDKVAILTDEELAARSKAAVEQLEKDLRSASKQRLSAMLAQCRGLIKDEAKSRHSGPYEFFIVDEYSADSYQAAAYVGGASAISEKERIKKFIAEQKKTNSSLQGEFMRFSKYAVISVKDGLGGPVKQVESYYCWLNPSAGMSASKSL